MIVCELYLSQYECMYNHHIAGIILYSWSQSTSQSGDDEKKILNTTFFLFLFYLWGNCGIYCEF